MRIRPAVWLVLACTCLGVLLFAGFYHQHTPLHAHITQQHLISQGLASLEIHLTDEQGLPIDQANIVSSAYMTNMNMPTREVYVSPRGEGKYLVQMHLSMAGPWAITIQARAQGFEAFEHTMHVDVL